MDPETIAIITILVMAACGGVYLTVLFLRTSRQRFGWHWAFVGTIASGLLTSLFVWFGLSLAHGQLTKGLPEWAIALLAFMWACACAFVPAVLTVWYYRRRVRHVDDAA